MPAPAHRLLHWNICHGGGPRRGPHILLELLALAPDVIVLTEFRTSFGGQIAGVLADHGWRYTRTSNPPPGTNGVLIAARHPFHTGLPPPRHDPARWLDVRFEAGLRLTAVHVPDARRGDTPAIERKARFWSEVERATESPTPDGHVIIGDFNTTRHGIDERGSTSTLPVFLGRLAARGYADAHHLSAAFQPGIPGGYQRGFSRASSWFSHTGEGFRLDQALVSKPLHGAVRGLEHLDFTRDSGLSDHAALVLTLAHAGLPGGARAG